MSTTAALVEGHYITVRYPDAACQCGVSFVWNDRDKAHALHLLDVARAEERERIAGNLARTAGGYYGMSGPTGDQKIWYDALSHAARIVREGA